MSQARGRAVAGGCGPGHGLQTTAQSWLWTVKTGGTVFSDHFLGGKKLVCFSTI